MKALNTKIKIRLEEGHQDILMRIKCCDLGEGSFDLDRV